MTSAALPLRGRPRDVLLPVAAAALAVGGTVALAAGRPAGGVLFAGTALALATRAILARPERAVVLVVALLYTNAPVVAYNLHGLPYAVAAAVPGILLVPIVAVLARGERLRLGAPFGWIVAVLGVCAISTVTSSRPDEAAAHTVTFAIEAVALYALVVNAVRSGDTLRSAAQTIVVAGTGIAFLTVVQQLTGRTDHPFWGFAPLDPDYFVGHAATPRSYGPVGDPNYYAQLLLPALAIGLALAKAGTTRRQRLLALGGAGVMLAAIGFTGSRGATLALVVVAIALLVLRVGRPRHLLVMTLGVGVLVMSMPTYRERLASLGSLGGATAQAGADDAADQSTRSRATENLAALLALRDHPLLGVGPGVFPSLYQGYAAQLGLEVHEEAKRGSEAGQAPTRAAHNFFLGLGAELGIPGLLLVCGALAAALRGLLLARRRWLRDHLDRAHLASGLFAGLLGYLSAGLFLSLAFQRYLWLLVALAAATAQIARVEGRPGRLPDQE